MNHRFAIFRGVRRALWVLGFALCVPLASANSNTFQILEGAAEVERLTLKSASTQILYTRECDQCPMLALSVTPQTRFYDGSTPITLVKAMGLGRGATVFFDIGGRTVSRVVFWQ